MTAPFYKKGDFRRILAVLAAIEELESPTMVSIGKRTGLDKRSVVTQIEAAQKQAGVTIEKDGPTYKITDWGSVIRKEGAALALSGKVGILD